MLQKYICEMLQQNKIPFRPDLPLKLEIYLQMLREWNTRMDLTTVQDDEGIVKRHFIDSLIVLRTGIIPEGGNLIDVGTGAGFPGLVLSMARPDLQVTLLDSQQKRLDFLDAVCKETNCTNAVTRHARAEDGAHCKELREKFAVATARAVAPLNVLCEYLLPFVCTGGFALCWKGPSLAEEMEFGKKSANTLGGSIETPMPCSIAGTEWDHWILPIRKTAHTPTAYPRRAGIPKSKPLGRM